MPERPIKKNMLHFLQVIDFKRHGGIFIHTHMYVYLRETNQVTKPREPMEAAASEEASIRWCCVAVLHRPAVQIFIGKDSI